MARIRTIKPEFCDDEKLASISRDARLLYIGMWIFSDDFGVVKGNSKWLLNKIFPYDSTKVSVFDKWLDELNGIDLIRPFEFNGEKFFYIKNFTLHQKIDKPSKTRNPEPPEEVTLAEYSPSTSRGLAVVGEGSLSLKGSSSLKGNGVAFGSSSRTTALSDEDFLKELKNNQAYKNIDVDRELAKMDAWFLTPKGKGRHKTRRFIVNWLNKCEGFGTLQAQDTQKTQQNKHQANTEAKARAEAIKKARLILSERLKCLPQDVPIIEIEREIARGKSP